MAVRSLLTSAVAALAALAVLASPAAATFHLMSIREVYPGTASSPGSEYVELQMWAEDQNHVAGHLLRTYDFAGAVTGIESFLADVPRGANQSTLVLATPEAESEFGFAADAPVSPSDRLDPSGGAVCWENIDCVSWGDFSGSLPSPAGAPAPPIPDGLALRRTIAPGCATLLEPIDDRDNSAADLAPVFPAPRPNSTAPSESPCGLGGSSAGPGPGQAAAGREAPATLLRRHPPRRSRDRTPTFGFAAAEAGARFECRTDGSRYRSCRSPVTLRALRPGRHVFAVRARDDSEEVDPSPATWSFRILRAPLSSVG
jgi:hypothetical protein